MDGTVDAPGHQHNSKGEPAIIAGITEEIVKSYDIDRIKVFVAGLSAGGAMAVIMGETYPKLFSAVGVHSGLPYRSANDVVSAFAAMRGGGAVPSADPKLRTIVFHGDADNTVAPSNGESILSGAVFSTVESEHVAGQYTRRVVRDSQGMPVGDTLGRAVMRQGAILMQAAPMLQQRCYVFFLSVGKLEGLLASGPINCQWVVASCCLQT